MVQKEDELRALLLETYRVTDCGELARKFSYRQWKEGATVGTVGVRGYKTLSVKGRRYPVHRLVFLMELGYLPKMIDHINGIKTDNRICNLRPTAKPANALNLHKPHRDSRSGVLGVAYRADIGKWSSRLQDKSLGVFLTKEEAQAAYEEAKLRLVEELA